MTYATDGKIGVPALSSEAVPSQALGTVAIFSENRRGIYAGPAVGLISASTGVDLGTTWSVSQQTTTSDGTLVALAEINSGEYGWFLDQTVVVT